MGRTVARATIENLPAKLLRPQSDDAILRPRLFRALDRLTKSPIVWIHAPAGAGKTTIVSTYLRARRAAALWYVVDAGDADPSTFYHYAQAGLAALVRGAPRQTVPRGGSPEAERVFAARFAEALFAALPRGTFLVLDNYQNAGDAGAWEALFRELCRAVTPRVRIVVASRTAPPASLAAALASGELKVLDGSSLRFNRTEVRTVIQREARSVDARELLARTDGWAVAVVLLLKTSARHAPIDDREGVFRFIASELLQGLDDAHRELLMQVALMPTFTVAMARALTADDRAEAIIASLLRDHLLVERHGEGSFRLHDLIRAFLLAYGERTSGPESWSALARRAARLLAADDQVPAALDLIATAGDVSALVELIEGAAPTLAAQARFHTLRSAIARVPVEIRAERPWLLFWEAAATLDRPGSSARQLAEAAFAHFRASNDLLGALLSWALVLPAIVYAGDDHRSLEAWLAVREELPRDIPVPQIASRVALSELLGRGFLARADTSLEATQRALDAVLAAGTPDERAHACCAALFQFCIAGHFDGAREMVRLAKKELEGCVHDPLPRFVCLEAEAFLEMASSRYRAAGEAVEQGLALAQRCGIHVWRVSMQYMGAMGALARRDLATAERLLHEAGAVANNRLAQSHHECGSAWLAFERGDLEGAAQWIRRANDHAELVGYVFAQLHSLTGALLIEAERRDRGAVRKLAAEVESAARRIGGPWSLGADVALAYARLRVEEGGRGELGAALRRVREAGMSSPTHTTFLGPTIAQRVALVAFEDGIEPELGAALVRAHELTPPAEAMATPAWPWPIKIRTFGSLSVEIDGRPLVFGRKTPTVLLALLKLLAAAREPLRADRLAAALWTGGRRGSLDTGVYRLRRLLGAEAVESGAGCLSLAASACWTDVRALWLWSDRIDALTRDSPMSTLEACERHLLDLHRGPFGAEGDPRAILVERGRLHARHTRSLAALARAYEDRGLPERAAALTAPA